MVPEAGVEPARAQGPGDFEPIQVRIRPPPQGGALIELFSNTRSLRYHYNLSGVGRNCARLAPRGHNFGHTLQPFGCAILSLLHPSP